jgi:hypothetical protein
LVGRSGTDYPSGPTIDTKRIKLVSLTAIESLSFQLTLSAVSAAKRGGKMED